MSWVRSNRNFDALDQVTSQKNAWKKSSDRANQKTESTTRHLASSYLAWTEDWKQIAQNPTLGADLVAGITVAAVALPLNLALAVAAGLPPSTGITAGAIGGFLAGFLGGSRWQVSGPAAALNVMVFTIVAKYGAAGAAVAAIVTGLMSIFLSVLGMGKWMGKVPDAVIGGFTTGVGLKLLDQQLPHLFGVDVDVVEMISTIHDPAWLQEVSWNEVLCGMTVVFFVLSMKSFKKAPGALIGLTVATFVANYLNWDLKKVGQLSGSFPGFTVPELDPGMMGSLLLLCIPLSLLGAVESLLSARVIDHMEPKSKPHHPNLELLGQGIANIVTGFFQGMPVTGVVVRSTVNIQSGGKTRMAAMFHGAILLIALLYFSDLLAKVPTAALAGLLCLIGFRLVEFHHFFDLIRKNWLEAVSFAIAMIGTLNNELFVGLLGAIALILVGRMISDRLKLGDEFAANDEEKNQIGARAVIRKPMTATPVRESWHVKYFTPPSLDQWMVHIDERPWFHPTSYVHPNATVIGRVIVERAAHIAAETSVRADEGTPFFIGNRTNLQDGVVLHALKDKFVQVQNQKWAIYIDEQVSVAHQALIHGPCFIGARSFVGFKAVVHDSVVNPDCFVGIGSVVVGVEVPPGRFVPPGSVIDTQEKANLLPEATDMHHHFNEEVVEVNEGLVSAYQWFDQKEKKTWTASSSESSSVRQSPSYY